MHQTAKGIAAVALLTAAAMLLYELQFAETGAYLGLGPLAPHQSAGYWLLLVAWVTSIGCLLPTEVRRPSDIYLAVYLVTCALWSASYWPATGYLELGEAVLLWILLLVPALAVVLMRGSGRQRITPRPLRVPFALPANRLIPTLIGVLGLTMVIGYRTGGADAGFDFEQAVVRRLAGRESFGNDILGAYLLQMSVNGVAPFLAFLGGLRRSQVAVACALAFTVFSFWLLGLKAPALNVVVLATLGVLLRNARIRTFPWWLVGALGTVLVTALVELYFVPEVSLIAEFGVRRVVLVSSMIQVYFMDAISGTGVLSLLFQGLDVVGSATVEYHIGVTYFNNEETNANTNAFLHELAAKGLLSYALVVAASALFVAWCDRAFVHHGREDGFAFAAILGIMLVEQAFTTALVSSGILLCLFLSILFSRAGAQRAAAPLAARTAHEA